VGKKIHAPKRKSLCRWKSGGGQGGLNAFSGETIKQVQNSTTRKMKLGQGVRGKRTLLENKGRIGNTILVGFTGGFLQKKKGRNISGLGEEKGAGSRERRKSADCALLPGDPEGGLQGKSEVEDSPRFGQNGGK